MWGSSGDSRSCSMWGQVARITYIQGGPKNPYTCGCSLDVHLPFSNGGPAT